MNFFHWAERGIKIEKVYHIIKVAEENYLARERPLELFCLFLYFWFLDKNKPYRVLLKEKDSILQKSRVFRAPLANHTRQSHLRHSAERALQLAVDEAVPSFSFGRGYDDVGLRQGFLLNRRALRCLQISHDRSFRSDWLVETSFCNWYQPPWLFCH